MSIRAKCVILQPVTNALNAHELIHSTGNPKRKCPQCAQYISRKNIRSHMSRMHNGSIKSLKCPDCDKTFKMPYDLKKHEVLHTEDRPHGSWVPTVR